MRSTIAVVAAFAAIAAAAPQGVTANITPTGAAPAGCTSTYPLFELSVVNATTANSKNKRSDTLQIKLDDGILTDSEGRRGYIAANYQFQFDAPPVQTGAIYTGGFTVCGNGTLALGASAIWWECLSGNFYNLYDEDWAPQCSEIFLDTIKVDSSSSISVTTASATGTAATTSASAVTSSADIVSSISDAQPQAATTTTAVTSSVSVVVTSAAVLSSISDNQIQAPTSTSAVSSSVEVVSAATSTAAVTTSVALISSISDYQIQAPTSTSAMTSSVAVVYNATATSSIQAYTGAASIPTMAAQVMLAAAGLAVFAL